MRVFALGKIAIGALAVAQLAAAEPPSGALETIVRVAPGLWSIHQRQPFELQPVGNVEVIEQNKGLVLIDGGASPGSARRITQLIKSVSSKPVTAIAITHWHSDHSLGVTTILKSWPNAEVIATNATRRHILGAPMAKLYPEGAPDAAKLKPFLDAIAGTLERVRKYSADPALPDLVRAGYASAFKEFTLYQQDIEGAYLPARIDGFETERVLEDPSHPVHLLFLGPGNTDGDLIGWLPRQRALVTGDLVVAPIPYGFDSYVASWQSDLLLDLRTRMAAIGPRESLDQATKELAPAFEKYQKRFAGDDPWLQKWFVKFWKDPITEALWKESRGISIEQGGG